MDDEDFENRVRARAHLLWEQEGRPEGKSEEHWRRAAALVESERDAGPAPADLALTEMAGETTDAPRSAKASAPPRKAGAASKSGAAPSPMPAVAPSSTKSKRAPKSAR